MKNCKLFTLLASLAIALLFATASYGQAPQFVGVGSSALFPSAGIAAVSADPITGAAAQCGTEFWSGGTSMAAGVDGRSDGGTAVPHEPGNIWVAWDNDAAPTKVCTYLSVDSIVGQRLFLGQSATGNATLSLSASAKTTAGANKVSYVADICNAGASPASATVSSITEVGTTATFTATAALAGNFANGASVTISGSSIAAYNSTFTIGNVTATTFTFTTLSSGNGPDSTGAANVGVNCPGLPVAVYNLINNAHFNVGLTDIRAEDGQYAYHRAACTLIPGDTTKACMGYGPEGHIGTAVLSSYTNTSAQVVAYAISGADPLSGLPIPAFTTIPVGAEAVVVFVNTSNTAAGHLGNAAFTNVPMQVLSNYYAGYAGGTADMNPAVLPANALIHIVEREPVSGTYNTFEFGAIHTATDNRTRSQETGITPTAPCFAPPAAPVACGNPLWVSGADTATRARAIGTGDEVTAVSAGNAFINPVDSLGYAFFSLGSFGGKANIKYLSVGGLDPLYANGVNPTGAFPNCSGFFNAAPAFSCGVPGLPTFQNVLNGDYRPWSTLRALTYVPSPAGVVALIQAAQDQAAPINNPHIADIVPFRYCANAACGSFTQGVPVFKAHYGLSGFPPSNGNIPASTEAGGDMAGGTFTIQSELDYSNFVGGGAELVNYFQ